MNWVGTVDLGTESETALRKTDFEVEEGWKLILNPGYSSYRSTRKKYKF
jgi:hypothetical protein